MRELKRSLVVLAPLWLAILLMGLMLLLGPTYPSKILAGLVALCLVELMPWAYFANEFLELDPTWSKPDPKTGIRCRVIRSSNSYTIEYHSGDIVDSWNFKNHIEGLKRLEAEGKIGPFKPPLEIGGIEQ